VLLKLLYICPHTTRKHRSLDKAYHLVILLLHMCSHATRKHRSFDKAYQFVILLLCMFPHAPRKYRSLGKAYQFVKGERSRQKNGLEAQVKDFEKLVSILRGHDANCGVGCVGMDAKELEAQVQRVLQNAHRQREELWTSQKEIQDQVAACVEGVHVLQVRGVASLEDLPEEVRTRIQNRNLMRAKHYKDVRSASGGLLQAVMQASKHILSSKVSQEGVLAIKDKCGLDEAIKNKSYEKREERLEIVLGAARVSAEAYNAANAGSGSQCGLMGSCVNSVPMTQEEKKIFPAMSMFDDWVEIYLKNVHAERSDAAVKSLQVKLGDAASVGPVLGLSDGEVREEDGLEKALETAGSAIREEHEHQCNDALSFFPCTVLLHAGRQLLEIWKTESATIRHAVEVCGMLDADLKEFEACLDSSGLLSKEKDELVQKLQAARILHDDKLEALAALTPAIKNGNELRIRSIAQTYGLQGVPTVELMSKLRQEVNAASRDLTTVMLQLTGEIQHHFPEVILLVGKGLPSELGLLWRPSQSLGSSDEKELVANTRHRVWRVRDDETWYAIKEYPIRQASDLLTCFKEAAISYRHRHHNIVEVKALFVGTGDTGNTFNMQMPWYKHGSVDKWVRGDQKPRWPKVRNVLLDALVGLAHLHENGILHCDVKPTNILVDDMEHGRVSDFDISINTKERTSDRASMTMSMRATALGMTIDFAAPELKSSGQATKHTDMFAYGKTVLCVQVYCEPGGQDAGDDKARGQTAELVRGMTSENPNSRPSAKDVIERSSFFAILKEVRIKVPSVCLFCVSNNDDGKKDTDAGIECSEGHFHCGSCVSILVQDFLKVENQGKRARLRGEVRCFKCPTECNAPGFKERDLARHLSVDDYQAYLKSRLEILEADFKAKLEEESKRQVAEEIARLKVLDEHERRVLLARKHIEEEIMQPKCPRPSCRRGFLDFEGCFAISCSSCACKFCGWCLEDCGDHDAHAHVRQCAKVPRGVDALFPRMPTVRAAFEKTHKERCRERIKRYIDNELDPDIHERVRQEVVKIDSELSY
jgi:hypothetical protein